MLLRGLGDDSLIPDIPTDINYSPSAPDTSANYSFVPAPVTFSTAPAADSGSGSAMPSDISSGGSGLNFTDIANAVAKVIPSLVTGAVVYKKATAPATTVSPSIPYSYNPAYSGYYGTTGLPAVPGYPGLTGQVAPDNTMLYVALGIAGLFVLKGLRG